MHIANAHCTQFNFTAIENSLKFLVNFVSDWDCIRKAKCNCEFGSNLKQNYLNRELQFVNSSCLKEFETCSGHLITLDNDQL